MIKIIKFRIFMLENEWPFEYNFKKFPFRIKDQMAV